MVPLEFEIARAVTDRRAPLQCPTTPDACAIERRWSPGLRQFVLEMLARRQHGAAFQFADFGMSCWQLFKKLHCFSVHMKEPSRQILAQPTERPAQAIGLIGASGCRQNKTPALPLEQQRTVVPITPLSADRLPHWVRSQAVEAGKSPPQSALSPRRKQMPSQGFPREGLWLPKGRQKVRLR
jgi:hypothetical protein